MASSYDDVEDNQDTTAPSDWIKAVLKKDYNIELTMPEDRLYPTPSRALYVRWIKSLLDSTNPSWYENFDPESEAPVDSHKEEITGLDIGTGASAIYPLLALRLYPKWFMYGTEIDTTSFEHATKNLKNNKLDPRCKLLQRNPTQPLIATTEELERNELDFIMTNPPFFSTIAEWQDSLSGKGKEKPPDSVCSGAQAEMVYEGGTEGGGDYAFALRLYRESTQQQQQPSPSSTARAQWYSVMFGKKQSAQRFVALLQAQLCLNFATFLLGVASRTRRWVVAWSWRDLRPQSSIARTGGVPPSLNPASTDYSITYPSWQRTQRVQQEVVSILSALHSSFEWKWNEKLGTGVCRTREIVWNRSFRRRAKLMAEGKSQPLGQPEVPDASDKPVGLGLSLAVEDEQVLVRWTQGTQRVWFESFCGYLHEHLRPLLASATPELEKPVRHEDVDLAHHAHGIAGKGNMVDGDDASRAKIKQPSAGTTFNTAPSDHDFGSTDAVSTTEDNKFFDQADASTHKRRKLT